MRMLIMAVFVLACSCPVPSLRTMTANNQLQGYDAVLTLDSVKWVLTREMVYDTVLGQYEDGDSITGEMILIDIIPAMMAGRWKISLVVTKDTRFRLYESGDSVAFSIE